METQLYEMVLWYVEINIFSPRQDMKIRRDFKGQLDNDLGWMCVGCGTVTL